MSRTRMAATAIGLAGVLAASQAQAQSASNSEQEIALLKQQLKMLEQKLDKLQNQTAANTAATAKARQEAKAEAKAEARSEAKAALANANAAIPVKGPVAPSGVVVTMPNNRPTICTADEQNCVAITSRVHWDVGGYNYRPDTASTVPQKLDSGENVRRARIGIVGKFFGDWNYSLIYDFGGTADGFGGTGAAGGTAVGFLPGGGTSGIENAYLSYTGLKPFGGKMAVEAGVMDIAWTLDESTSSNDIMFMERASAGIIAQNIAAGDFRSAVGTRWWNDQLWMGAYVTGPTTGAIHSASSVSPPGSSEQYGAVARIAGNPVSGNGYSVHVGADAEWLIQPPRNQVTQAQTLTLSDRPELRIDPTTLISTGAIANVSGAQVYGVEAAATYGSFIAQGEYYWFNVDRTANTGLPPLGASSLKFDGGYAQVGYVLTGESRAYNAASASYGGIKPANPFSLAGGGWGAWEIAGRVSTMNLNDQLATAAGIAGGRQTIYTAALNWYVNNNVRFMLDYLHGDISKQASATSSVNTGSTFNAVAMRTQVAF
ncbi:OprO/OprP family phosphate-selective porin [Bradyrhizobium sp. WYCCWR 13023]|uniref:OprO/OprP family phosphate-selective porin n=1 Tax=Bradyrhizobium zhengyangense TaxID=2911009 RepID=A0A9X1UCH2_9BRAD|nr:OprO/OprP family phosphate-selective porin [Bradyrhizobium zhengyangense]MCG2632386.1 OprO/OprP family phosphate-selective porin [Bradyrhizobium zhengyangense]MCG2672235.1 OprO/OprP family phosphate-selective porin [Bradyrhizobium zhengyangense]